MVAGLGGADEVVVGDVEQRPRPPGSARCVRSACSWGVSPCASAARCDLEAVLVGAGEEEHVVAEQAVPAGEGVGGRPSCRRGRCGARR